MKLDEKYFEEKVSLVSGKFKGLHVVNTRILGNVLKQIARDGAEAQKVEDRTVIEFLHDGLEDLFIEGQQYEIDCESGNAGNMEESINRARIKILAAINSATVKWEVPGE